MLIESMTREEVTKEILYDYLLFKPETAIRFANQYDRERNKLKIPKDKVYVRFFQLKTKKKNIWLFMASKKELVPKYQGTHHIDMAPLCYYHSNKGLKVFKVLLDEDESIIGLDVFKGHLFERYNARLKLGLSLPLDKVKRFFTQNYSALSRIKNHEGKLITFTKVKEGLLLGDVQGTWMVNNTFISPNLLFKDQIEEDAAMTIAFEKEIEQALNENNSAYESKVAIMKGLS